MEPDRAALIPRQQGLTRLESFRELALSDGLLFSGFRDPCADGLFGCFGGLEISRHLWEVS